jgi:hypothetical protein
MRDPHALTGKRIVWLTYHQTKSTGKRQGTSGVVGRLLSHLQTNTTCTTSTDSPRFTQTPPSRKRPSMWPLAPTLLSSRRPRGKNRIQPGRTNRGDRGRGQLCARLSAEVSARSNLKRLSLIEGRWPAAGVGGNWKAEKERVREGDSSFLGGGRVRTK